MMFLGTRVVSAMGWPPSKSNPFMDVDDLLPGQRFDRQLAKALDACDVLIADIATHLGTVAVRG
jgi:hypothetical protein